METGVHLNGNGQVPVQKYWEELLVLIQQDKIHLLNMVTHRYELEDMEKVYDAFNRRAKVCRRSLLRQNILSLRPLAHLL